MQIRIEPWEPPEPPKLPTMGTAGLASDGESYIEGRRFSAPDFDLGCKDRVALAAKLDPMPAGRKVDREFFDSSQSSPGLSVDIHIGLGWLHPQRQHAELRAGRQDQWR